MLLFCQYVVWSDGVITSCLLSVETLSYSDNCLKIYLYGDYDYYLKVSISRSHFDSLVKAFHSEGHASLLSERVYEVSFAEVSID